MGVPKFFRWVTDRYPTILSGPLNPTSTNMNVDNLYLDMNGVIHESARMDTVDTNAPEDVFFESILQNIFNEVRRIFDMVLPQRLLYIAVDGVAPRAKLNQQRARRFKSAKERVKAMQDAGVATSFDSNCITPGTAFMAKLSTALKVFIEHMMKTDARWGKLQILFSGSEVPGEGEHKIISYIRTAKQQPDYAANLRHCILGADADMIMLALATHEPYFLVLRDALLFGGGGGGSGGKAGGGKWQKGRAAKPTNSTATAAGPVTVTEGSTTESTTTTTADASTVPQPSTSAAATNSGSTSNRARAGNSNSSGGGKVMNYVRINVLRECLATELLEDLNPAEYNIERVIDDFVFLTFLVGNDFLPSLPAINIGDQAFDLIFDAYKTVLASEPGCYLVHEGSLDRARMELIFALIGVTEKSLFYDQLLMAELKRKQAEERRAKQQHYRALRAAAEGGDQAGSAQGSDTATPVTVPVATQEGAVASSIEVPTPASSSSAPQTPVQAPSPSVADDASSVDDGILFVPGAVVDPDANVSAETLLDREEHAKNAYYKQKLGLDVATAEGQAALRDVVCAYLLGLEWCLKYYSTGCCSCSWFYPYHYGPFLQDMTGLTELPAFDTVVALDQPLLPFQQLLACLPSASAALLPLPYRALMCDPTSPLAHIYPDDFSTDRNGKKQEYEAVVLLPFINLPELLAAEAQCVPTGRLSADEVARNQFGVSYLYQHAPPTAVSASGHASVTTAVTVTEHPSVFTPGVCFAAALIPGTVPPVISIPGFPTKAALEEVVNYAKGYGKGKGSKRNRVRPNCYGVNGGESDSSGIADARNAFPMPGLPPTSTADAPISTAAQPQRTQPISSSDSSTLELRLVLDARTSAFLHAVAAQVAAQSPFFTPYSELFGGGSGDGAGAGGPTPAVVQFSLSSLHATGSVLTRCREALVEGDVLSKAAAVFGTVTGALQPVGLLSMDGTVSIKFVDVSHLAQLEEFLCQRLLGNALLEQLCALSIGPSAGASAQSSASGGLVGSGIGFARKVILGSYAGADTERFVSWLNKELYKLQAHLPQFTCATLQCVEETADGKEKVLASVELTGSSGYRAL